MMRNLPTIFPGYSKSKQMKKASDLVYVIKVCISNSLIICVLVSTGDVKFSYVFLHNIGA